MRPLWTVSLAAVLIASALAVLPGSAHGSPAAPGSPASPRPFAAVGVFPTDMFGNTVTEFGPGYANGAIYFFASDYSADTSANVTITDQNATRDHISVPAAAFTVNFNRGPTNSSYLWGIHYTLPFGLADGGTWNITIKGTAGGNFSMPFSVYIYTATLTPASQAVLPGHVATVLYDVNASVNDAPYPNLTAVTLGAWYYRAGVLAAIPGTPASLGAASSGMYNLTVPSDAQTAVIFELWANVSAASVSMSQEASLYLPVGTLGVPLVTLSDCSTFGCVSDAFANGTPVYVLVQAEIVGIGFSAPATGITVSFLFESGTTRVTAPGSPPATVVTNATGGAAVVFVASSPPFSTTTSNAVVVTLTDPVNPTSTTTSTSNFFVTSTVPIGARLQVTLDSAQYYGGDHATATWSLWGTSSAITQGWTMDAWQAWESPSATYIGGGKISSTSTSGTFTVNVPMNYSGWIRVTVSAHNATGSLSASAPLAVVSPPTILLNPSELFYLPGDHITVAITTEGQIFQSTTLWESVTDPSGTVWTSGPVSGGSVAFTVPQIAPPNSFRINVAAQSASLGLVSAATVTVSLGSGYVLNAGVATASNYIDGSFQPGQTIQVKYSISAIGTTALPKVFQVALYSGGLFFFGNPTGSALVQSTDPNGQLTFTLPSGMVDGDQQFTVIASLAGCNGCIVAGTFGVLIHNNPSVLGYEIGAGSGLTVGWLILFLLGVLVVLGALWMRRGRRGGPREAVKPYSTSSMGSGSGSSSAPAAEWKEGSPPVSSPPSGAANPPPLPNPPTKN